MTQDIRILGQLKGVSLKSSLDDKNQTTHTLNFKIDLVEGADKIQNIVDLLKQHLQIELKNVQPKLPEGGPRKPHNDD